MTQELEFLIPELKESEDEMTRNEIIAFIEQAIHRGGGTPIPQEQEDRWIAWLKSLRPQKQWKPSEDQLRELENVFSPDTDSWDEDVLRELYKQLKQL